MLGCYQDVTIWNRYRDHDNKNESDRFYCHVIPVKCKYKVTQQEGTASRLHTVIIPQTERYKPYSEWKNLPGTEQAFYFTLNIGDIVALGAHEKEMEASSETKMKLDLMPNCFNITLIQENATSGFGRHYRIEGD